MSSEFLDKYLDNRLDSLAAYNYLTGITDGYFRWVLFLSKEENNIETSIVIETCGSLSLIFHNLSTNRKYKICRGFNMYKIEGVYEITNGESISCPELTYRDIFKPSVVKRAQ